MTSVSSASSGLTLQALRDLFQTQSASSAGQSSPSEGTFSTQQAGAQPPPPPGPPPADMAGGGISSDTMSALLGNQEVSDPLSSLVDSVISELDSDGDGGLSLDEVGTALGASDSSELAEAFSELDSDGDGVMSADEMSSGLAAKGPPPGGPPPGAGSAGGASAEEAAQTVFDAADTNEDGTVSLDEMLAALDTDDTSDASALFSSLDADASGGVSQDELTSAFTALIEAQVQAYGRWNAVETSSLEVAA